jgi:anoctamin-7
LIYIKILNQVITLYQNLRKEICNKGAKIRMCPLCIGCSYWNLSETCTSAQISAVFDNSSALFFSIFMSLWGIIKLIKFQKTLKNLILNITAVCFVEYWKRKNASLAYKWECLDFEEEVF